jgi:hypothetical protein
VWQLRNWAGKVYSYRDPHEAHGAHGGHGAHHAHGAQDVHEAHVTGGAR